MRPIKIPKIDCLKGRLTLTLKHVYRLLSYSYISSDRTF